MEYGTPADRQVHVDVKSKSSGNVWRIYVHGSVTSNVRLLKLGDVNGTVAWQPQAHGAWVHLDGRVCVYAVTFLQDEGWTDEAIELCYIAQVLGFTYDEQTICQMGYV